MYEQTTHVTPYAPTMAITPALLIAGSAESTADYAVRYINKLLCPDGGCNACVSCTNVAQHNHHSLLWIEPEQRYTLETIAPIAGTIALTLEEHNHFFFVLAAADTLSVACANSLLKLVEEPPAGYHFIFLAQQVENILPTIRSRCLISQLQQDFDERNNHPLFSFFTYGSMQNPALFLKTLEQSKITEKESIELFDALFNHWAAAYKKDSDEKKQLCAYKVLHYLRTYGEYLPMSGSAKLFLKTLYLGIHDLMSKK